MVNVGSIAERLLRRIFKAIKNPFSEEVLVLGDSHVAAFDFFSPKILISDLIRYKFTVCSVGGATLSGLNNLNSKTQAKAKFLEQLKYFKGKKIILMLGEVDLGFLIWLKAEKSKSSVDIFYKIALDNYYSFISELAERYSLLVISCPLPTIKDHESFGDVAIIRSLINIKQSVRTTTTLKFNNDVAEYCKKHGVNCVNLDGLSLGLNGYVKSELLNKDPLDHHYDMKAYCNLLAPSVKKLL
jgi:hypothetical protein